MAGGASIRAMAGCGVRMTSGGRRGFAGGIIRATVAGRRCHRAPVLRLASDGPSTASRSALTTVLGWDRVVSHFAIMTIFAGGIHLITSGAAVMPAVFSIIRGLTTILPWTRIIAFLTAALIQPVSKRRRTGESSKWPCADCRTGRISPEILHCPTAWPCTAIAP